MALLTTQPLWLSGALVIGAATLLAAAAPVLVRRRVALARLKINNEVAGFTFAILGHAPILLPRYSRAGRTESTAGP